MNNGFSPLSKEHFAAIIVAASNSSERARRGADYVCVGTNDDAQIQTAIDIANSYGGGTVRLMPGTYMIHNNLQMKSNVTLLMTEGVVLKTINQLRTPLTSDLAWNQYEFTVADATGFKPGMRIGWTKGNGTGYVPGYIGTIKTINGNTITVENEPVKRAEGANLTVSEGAHLISYFSTFLVNDWTSYDGGIKADNWAIIGGCIDGNKANQSVKLENKDMDANGIMCSSSRNVLIQNVEVKNTPFQGIHICGREASNVILQNCNVHDTDFAGICIDSANGPLSVLNCRATNNLTTGLQLVDSKWVDIIGGYYANNSVWNIRAGYIDIKGNNRIIGAYVYGGTNGISLMNTNYTVIDSCIIEGCSASGVEIYGEGGNASYHNIICNCIIKSVTQGIYEGGSSGHDNIFYNIKFDDCPNKFVVLGINTIRFYSENGRNYMSGELLVNEHHIPETTLHTTEPTVNDDIELGYRPGDTWINTATPSVWVCISNADGAAVWKQTG